MDKEIWKDIPGWEEFYEISTIGRVWSKVSQRIVFPKLQKGYLNICLWRKDRKINTGIHRIVAITFIPNPDNKPCVNHKKGIKYDNRPDEIEWCTYSENLMHSINILGNDHYSGLKYRNKNPLIKSKGL